MRWADGKTLDHAENAPIAGKAWTAPANGIWWVTDNKADRIVEATVRRFGPYGDTSIGPAEWHGGDTGPAVPEPERHEHGRVGRQRNDCADAAGEP